MKKKSDPSLLFLAVALLPALLVVIVYFFLTAKAASHNEAMEKGFTLALWFFGVIGISRLFINEEIDLRETSFFPIAIASLAIASLILGLGNQIVLFIVGGLGIILSFLVAYLLKDPKQRGCRTYRFTIVSIACSCAVNLLFALALSDQFDLADVF